MIRKPRYPLHRLLFKTATVAGTTLPTTTRYHATNNNKIHRSTWRPPPYQGCTQTAATWELHHLDPDILCRDRKMGTPNAHLHHAHHALLRTKYGRGKHVFVHESGLRAIVCPGHQDGLTSLFCIYLSPTYGAARFAYVPRETSPMTGHVRGLTASPG